MHKVFAINNIDGQLMMVFNVLTNRKSVLLNNLSTVNGANKNILIFCGPTNLFISMENDFHILLVCHKNKKKPKNEIMSGKTTMQRREKKSLNSIANSQYEIHVRAYEMKRFISMTFFLLFFLFVDAQPQLHQIINE